MPWEETAGCQPPVEPHHGPAKIRNGPGRLKE